ncbi:hypothetical protein SEA_HIBISCUS_44 [Gordonia phage Hibiscus]
MAPQQPKGEPRRVRRLRRYRPGLFMRVSREERAWVPAFVGYGQIARARS